MCVCVPCPNGVGNCLARVCSWCVDVGSRNRIGNRAFLASMSVVLSICCIVISVFVFVSTLSESSG